MNSLYFQLCCQLNIEDWFEAGKRHAQTNVHRPPKTPGELRNDAFYENYNAYERGWLAGKTPDSDLPKDTGQDYPLCQR